uniref:glutamate synthase (ferredoxin) n=1 Tax=Cyanidium sp. THAL103 TaxID=3027999 RepID=A0A9Y1MYH4_9RHOD|nr:glutamate synthase [Cyanidium sp. THAL103]
MINKKITVVTSLSKITSNKLTYFKGYPSLVKEKDSCGVGFVASLDALSSHYIISKALEALALMEHRGACSSDKESGDGAGILTDIPWKIIHSWMCEKNELFSYADFKFDNFGVAMIFFPQNFRDFELLQKIIGHVFQFYNFEIVGWRKVPFVKEVLGELSLKNQPRILQLVVNSKNKLLSGDILDRKLYLVRRRIERLISELAFSWVSDFHFCSCSSKTIVYKGMLKSAVLRQFYQDLNHSSYESRFAIYHRRFSTNTMPKWSLAQPMRLLAHNGEINTLLGNLKWMEARESEMSHPFWKEEILYLKPITNYLNSDSANLDSVLELLSFSGRDCVESIMILIPEAYESNIYLNKYPAIRNFYSYYSGIQEAWDGPALVIFGDGNVVGATLDRNGLRPARYCLTKDRLLLVASEVGIGGFESQIISCKGRLGPGQMIVVNMNEKHLYYNFDVKNKIASKLSYSKLLEKNIRVLPLSTFLTKNIYSSKDLLKLQSMFGYTAEDVELVIESMASQGKEPTFCMGDDAPLAVLSNRPHVLYSYFKQRFAQVTNPPIDPLREGLVMSLSMYLGTKGNLLNNECCPIKLIKLNSPILNENDLKYIDTSANFRVKKFYAVFEVNKQNQSILLSLFKLFDKIEKAVLEGIEIIILSDHVNLNLFSRDMCYIPPLLVVGSVHNYLIKKNLRYKVSIIAETAQCWSTHHFACLLGYGANAIVPYLALETARQWWGDERTQSLMLNGRLPNLSLIQIQDNFCKSVENGLLKIMSKMGISLLTSYNGAQVFEILGLASDITEFAFKGTVSRIGGLSFDDLTVEVKNLYLSSLTYEDRKKLNNYGFVKYKPSGEYHINNPEMSKILHRAVRKNSYDAYEAYTDLQIKRPLTTLRDLFILTSVRSSINIDQVEPITSILSRFCTGGMSLGALSREAHETLAVAMNRIGGKSNSGEGGEDSLRFIHINDIDSKGLSSKFPHLKGLRNGDSVNSAIKQIASGRFGVTPEYLINASQLEIKIAQGAKPGEGGQLPGKKVSPYIAKLRACKPGVSLISPPPHHDIYSIEDLAQLIFDLHQINPQAKVSVKLVSEVGIGTVATGVAKANVDIIQISGHDGGTGASPLSSIKSAGSPWELGLHEVHNALLINDLRGQVVIRVDGGLRTGYDIVAAATLGAQEYGFGTIAMIASGCIMARVCHTNSCPVGVATQREELRSRYPGIPEAVVNYFTFLAHEVRSILANLGYRSLDEIIGNSTLLVPKKDSHVYKTKNLNYDLFKFKTFNFQQKKFLYPHSNGRVLDDDILNSVEIIDAIKYNGTIEKHLKINNTDRSVGGRISGFIASKYGDRSFLGKINLTFYGSAGQSFGVFNIQGVTLKLIGEANDYVGKGMSGGNIVIVPPKGISGDPSTQVIIGNTCLYGATGGYLFVHGQAGERFAVRNSMAISVVEGVGDHACEYMTGGIVIVLGQVGKNIAAGMTGGIAYFLDHNENENFVEKLNPEIVKIQRIITNYAKSQLKEIIELHYSWTASSKARLILDNWNEYVSQFWQVVPPSESNVLATNPKLEEESFISASS